MPRTMDLSEQSLWRHKTKKGLYTIVTISNSQASPDREDHPVLVIYADDKDNIWSKPIEEFLRKFKPWVSGDDINEEHKIFGWWFWNGYDLNEEGYFCAGEEDPASGKEDDNGHVWSSFPLYKD